MTTPQASKGREPVYIVNVWDCWGDIVYHERECTWEDVERIQERFEEEPDKMVVFEEDGYRYD